MTRKIELDNIEYLKSLDNNQSQMQVAKALANSIKNIPFKNYDDDKDGDNNSFGNGGDLPRLVS